MAEEGAHLALKCIELTPSLDDSLLFLGKVDRHIVRFGDTVCLRGCRSVNRGDFAAGLRRRQTEIPALPVSCEEEELDNMAL